MKPLPQRSRRSQLFHPCIKMRVILIYAARPKTVDEYAKSNGYTLVLDQRAVLYGSETHDISDAVLQLLNSRFKKP